MTYLNIDYRLLTLKDYKTYYKDKFRLCGTGLIETMLWKNGKIRFWNDHYARLLKGATLLKLNVGETSAGQLYQAMKELITANEIKSDCMVRLRLFPNGDGLSFVLETTLPEWLSKKEEIIAHRIGMAQQLCLTADAFSALKTSRRGIYEIAGGQAKAKGWYDALLLNTKSNIAEATINNIFWIKDGVIFTPGLEEACIAGIMRQQILMAHLPWRVEEKSLDISGLKGADEVFLTNAVRGIQPVRLFEDTVYEMRISRKLRSLLQL